MPNNLIAIDIGSNLTKVLEAEFKRGVIEIASMESFRTPYKEGEIEENKFFEQVFKIVPQSKIKNSWLSISVPSPSINFATLELPKMPKQDLVRAVSREARRKIIPAPEIEDILDYTVLKEQKVKGITQLSLLASSGKRAVISKYVSLFKEEGLTPRFIGSTHLSLISYFLEYKHSVTENWAFIDIGHKNTDIVIFHKGDAVLTRSIPFACFDFIEAISKKTGLGLEKAGETFLAGLAKEEMLLANWQYLLSEFRRSFSYYKEITQGERVDSIMFSGGMFCLNNSIEFLKKNLGGNLGVFNLSVSNRISLKGFEPEALVARAPLFCTAAGLILGLMPARKPLLNFLPPEIPREQIVSKIRLISIRSLIFVAGIQLFLLTSFKVRAELQKLTISNLKKEASKEEYLKIQAGISEMKKRQSELQKKKDLIAQISKRRFDWERLFRILSENIPERAFIRGISVKYGRNGIDKNDPDTSGVSQDNSLSVDITGTIIGDYEGAVKELSDFYARLNNSGMLLKVSAGPLKFREKYWIEDRAMMTEVKEREFSITMKIKAE